MKIMISGEGGQGIQSMAKIIADAAYLQKYNVSYIPHYGVEMRMGISFAYVIISQYPIVYPKFEKADILAVLSSREMEIPQSFINKQTIIINAIGLNKKLKENNLNSKSLNILVLGAIIKELNTTDLRLDFNKVMDLILKTFEAKRDSGDNIQAFELGFSLSRNDYAINLSKNSRTFTPIISSDSSKQITLFPNLCKGCGLCIEKCPKKALFFSKNNVNYISRPIPDVIIEKCIACGICEQICPDCAIKVDNKNSKSQAPSIK